MWTRALGADSGSFGLFQLTYDKRSRSLRVALSMTTGTKAGIPGTGSILSWQVGRDGRAGRQRVVWTSRPGEVPFGLALGKRGRMMTTGFVDSSMSLVSPRGATIARTGDPETRTRPVPFDNPSGIAWVGKYAYVANPSAHLNFPENRAILRVYVGEQGQRPIRPAHLRGPGATSPDASHVSS